VYTQKASVFETSVFTMLQGLSMWRMIYMYCRMLHAAIQEAQGQHCVEKLAPLANKDLTLSMWRMICMYCKMLHAANQQAQGTHGHMAKVKKQENVGTTCKWRSDPKYMAHDLHVLQDVMCCHSRSTRSTLWLRS